MKYRIISTDWDTDQQSLSNIRDQVFIREQHISYAEEWDGKDKTATHFLATDSYGDTVGCARLLTEINLFHIGRVAVLMAYRQQGIGHQLVQFVVQQCRQKNPEFEIYLHAQANRVAFYQRLGFATHGDIFMDAGIPHIEMWHQN